MRHRVLVAALAAAIAAGCGSSADEPTAQTPTVASPPAASAPATTAEPAPPAPPAATTGAPTTVAPEGPVPLEITEVARDLDTVWSLAWDPEGRLWYTERGGSLSRLGGPSDQIEGVVENGEAGLMGLEIDVDGRFFLMYTAAEENRVVRLEPDGSQTVLVDGIAAGGIHDGGRIRLGSDGSLFVSTGDVGSGELAQDLGSLNGKILQVDADSGDVSIFSAGHRNAQGLCFAPNGRFYSTEHGPNEGDEINILTESENGGWPETVGNGIWNYTPTIAPAGCAYYDAELIPQWRGSLLFVTLKDQSLRRLTLAEDGSVTAEEVLYQGEFGRLRDVAVGPDGAVYLATSNHDGRGDPREGDDRILRIGAAA